MKDTDYLLQLAKQAKKDNKPHLVEIYTNNYKRLVLKKRRALTVVSANA